jgi:AcrR family transcriptional regulator
MAGNLPDGHDDYLQSLPPRAQKLLLAAQRLLVEEGYEGLSWARVAKEAEEQKSTIAYYFGNKAALVSALLRVIGQGTSTWLVEQCGALPPGHDRIDAYLRAHLAMNKLPQSFAFFDVLPHAIRSDVLRSQVAELYTWYRDMNLKALGLDTGSERSADAEAVAWFFIAAIDGILMQRALLPETYDAEAVYEKVGTAFEFLVKSLQHRPDGVGSVAGGAGNGGPVAD